MSIALTQTSVIEEKTNAEFLRGVADNVKGNAEFIDALHCRSLATYAVRKGYKRVFHGVFREIKQVNVCLNAGVKLRCHQ